MLARWYERRARAAILGRWRAMLGGWHERRARTPSRTAIRTPALSLDSTDVTPTVPRFESRQRTPAPPAGGGMRAARAAWSWLPS
eukprot:3069509-Prymnesium_polylepis.1